ncbi:MAG: M23 family metallopeptidase [Candidatus Berkelbacteria bacterium]|nr:M23 family metallopeptidase [Candidatus Berkelbacteria bacterium]
MADLEEKKRIQKISQDISQGLGETNPTPPTSSFEVEEPEEEVVDENLVDDEQPDESPEVKVPEYVAPEGYQEPQPGGPAIEPKKSKLEQQKEELKNQAKEKIKDKVSDKAKQVAGDVAKKAGQWIAKQAAALGVKIAALTSEYWVPIVLVLIGLAIVIAGIVILIRSLQTPNSNGSSPVQAADIISDHKLIQSVLALSNSADFQKLLDENKNNLIADINSFEVDVKAKYPNDSRTATTISALDNVKTLIANYTKPDATQAKAIYAGLVAAIKPWAVNLNPGGMIFPAPGHSKGDITNDWNHNGHRGIDIMLDIGTNYYAPTDGTVVYLVDSIANYSDGKSHYEEYDENGGFGNAIIVKMDKPLTVNGSTAGAWEIHHLSPNTATVKVGDHVAQGQPIAKSGDNGSSSGPHTHFQVDKAVCSGDASRPCGVNDGISSTVDPKIILGW